MQTSPSDALGVKPAPAPERADPTPNPADLAKAVVSAAKQFIDAKGDKRLELVTQNSEVFIELVKLMDAATVSSMPPPKVFFADYTLKAGRGSVMTTELAHRIEVAVDNHAHQNGLKISTLLHNDVNDARLELRVTGNLTASQCEDLEKVLRSKGGEGIALTWQKFS